MAAPSFCQASYWKVEKGQYIACACFFASIFSIGASIGYSSPAVPDLKSPSNEFSVTDEQGALIGCVFFIGAIIGSIVAGPATQRFGHKSVTMVSNAWMAIGWLFIICANSVALLYIGRILTGVSFGIGAIVPLLYVAEIADKNVRGILISICYLANTLGSLYAFSLGIVLHWRRLALCIQALSLVAMITLYYAPDSPRWYYFHGMIEASTETLQWLRGEETDITPEMNTIKAHIENKKSEGPISIKELATRFVIFPMALVVSILVLQQFTGATVITLNLSEMLGEANTRLNANEQSVIVCAIEIIAVVPLLMLVDHLGRRIALIISFSVCVLMLVVLGINDVLKVHDPKYVLENMTWLPILCISVYKLGSSIGSAIPILIMIELYPSRTKLTACGITLVIYYALTFLVPSIYTYIVRDAGYYGMYWIFAGIGITAIVFVYFVVPETKVQSLEEIEEMMGPKTQHSDTAHL